MNENKEQIKAELQAEFSDVYDTTEMQESFKVDSFLAPYVYVERKKDNVKGTLQFTHMPRFYFDFQAA